MTDNTIDSEVEKILVEMSVDIIDPLASDLEPTQEAIKKIKNLIAQETNKAVEGLPQKTDQKCYNCGNPLFAYNSRARCLYCGCHEALTAEKGSNNV